MSITGSRSTRGRWARAAGIVATAVYMTLLSGACTSPGSPSSSSTTLVRKTGPVDVLFDSSLKNLMQTRIGPGFHAETGYSFEGLSAGSADLATQIIDRSHQVDVFVSASPFADDQLIGAGHGNLISWYATFATSTSATYTVTVVNNDPDQAAAEAFVAYLLSAAGTQAIVAQHLTLLSPAQVTGTGFPANLAVLLAS
jgi:ABC-type molybdate transport system substrate-binding protein